MRLDARNGPPDLNYTVYHAEECRVLRSVQWVDDELHQYGYYTGRVGLFALEVQTVQARRIVINTEHLLVTINPIEGLEDAGEAAPNRIVEPCTPT